jgi:biotin transport system substrate-specific component
LSGGRGGLGVFAGPTAGYLIGWIAGAWVVGAMMRVLPFKSDFTSALIASAVGGIFIIYLFGTPWLAWSSGLSLKNAAIASATFLPGDALKAIATAFIAQTYFQTFSSAAGARA